MPEEGDEVLLEEGGSFPHSRLRMSCRKSSRLDPRLSFFFSFVVVWISRPLSFPSIEVRRELSLLLKVEVLVLLFVLSLLLNVNPKPSPPNRPPPPCPPPPLPPPNPNPSATAFPVPPKTSSVTVTTVASAGLANSEFRLRGVLLNIEKYGIFAGTGALAE